MIFIFAGLIVLAAVCFVVAIETDHEDLDINC